jgi:rhodanese-related sulfurtransferase
MYKICWVVLLFFTLNLQASVQSVNKEQLDKWISKGIKVIDIRSKKQWNKTGIIPGSYTVTYKEKRTLKIWLRTFNRIVKNKSLSFVLVDQTGKKSSQLAKVLHKKYGYRNGFYLQSGIQEWKNNQGKMVKPK